MIRFVAAGGIDYGTAPFDMLKAKETLTRFGFQEEQATGVVTMTRDAVLESVATKEDTADLKVEIARMGTRLVNRGIVAAGIIISVLGFITIISRFIPGN